MGKREADGIGESSGRRARNSYGPIARAKLIWRKRGVLALLVRRDLKVRYADSVLGYLWSVLDPLMMGLIYWFIFTTVFSRSVGQDPYIIYLLAGMLPFTWFRSAMSAAAKAIKGERLVRSTALPREIWVLRLVLGKGTEYLLSLPVLIAFVAAYQIAPSWRILLMIPAMLIQLVLTVGLALLISAVGALIRDVDRVVGIFMRFLFYATPIIYGLKDVLDNPHVPGFIKDVYLINPVTGIVSMYRAGLFSGGVPATTIYASVAGALIALVLGWWVFMRLESTVLKEI